MFETVRIDSNLELPYKLIDIHEAGEQFTLSFKEFDPDQSDYSIKRGGLIGTFEVTYNCGGINSQFVCDMTIGNLFAFYVQLENCHECLPGTKPIAVLEDYGSDKHTNMTFNFAKKDRVVISGSFLNGYTIYRSGIQFEMEIDTFYVISEILNSLEIFFSEIKRIQGHSTFY